MNLAVGKKLDHTKKVHLSPNCTLSVGWQSTWTVEPHGYTSPNAHDSNVLSFIDCANVFCFHLIYSLSPILSQFDYRIIRTEENLLVNISFHSIAQIQPHKADQTNPEQNISKHPFTFRIFKIKQRIRFLTHINRTRIIQRYLNRKMKPFDLLYHQIQTGIRYKVNIRKSLLSFTSFY